MTTGLSWSFKSSATNPINPKNLPGGNLADPPFTAVPNLSFEAVNAQPFFGVNPLEEVGITFKLISGGTYDSVINSLNTGELRIGIHVIDFADEGSESFIVPEPLTLGLLAMGSIVLLNKRRKGKSY